MSVPSLFRVLIPCSDIERATEFYRAVTTLDGERVSDGRHYFECGAVMVACYDSIADGDPVPPRPLSDPLYFSAKDLEAMRATVLAAGGRVESTELPGGPAGEIKKRPWGELSFYAFDPFGNPLCFVAEGTEFRGR